jgi:hypothetical protein
MNDAFAAEIGTWPSRLDMPIGTSACLSPAGSNRNVIDDECGPFADQLFPARE